MRINNHHSLNSSMQHADSSIELKQGEVYKAQIKEKLNDSEALITIRGKEIKAKFEGGVPAGDRPTVQVTGKQDQLALVKEIVPQDAKGKQNISDEAKIFKSVGLTAADSPDLKQAVKLILDKGQPLSKEVVQELKSFFEKAEGNSQTKSDTVKALVNKGLEVTQTHLRSIHEALHGKPLNEVLTSIAKEVNPNFDHSSDHNEEFLKQKIVKNSETTAVAVTKAPAKESNVPAPEVVTASKSQQELSKIIGSVRKMVEKEPNLQKAIQKVKDEIIANPKMEREHIKQIEKVSSEAEKLQAIGKERLVQALKIAETQVLAKESMRNSEQMNVRTINEPVSLKQLVTEVRNNPNLQSSIEKVQTEISRNQLIPAEKEVKLEKTLNEAAALLRQGRITTGKEVLSQALLTVENEASENRQMQKQQPSELQKQSEVVKQVKEAVQQEPRLQKAVEQVRDQVVNNPKIDREVAQKVERAVREAVQLHQVGRESAGRERLVQALNQAEVEQSQVDARKAVAETRPSEAVRQVKEAVHQETRLQKAVEQVRDQVVNNSKVDREVAQKVERAVREAVNLQQMGRESAGREKLVQALNQAEVELSQAESRRNVVEPRPSEVVKQVKEAVQQEPKLQKAAEFVRDQVVNNPKISREIVQKVERTVREAVQLQQIGRENAGREKLVQALNQAEVELGQAESRKVVAEPRPSETVRQVKETVHQEPKLQKAAELVRDQVVNNPKIDREIAQKAENAVRGALQLQQVGREGAGREKLVQALNQAVGELSQAESQKVAADTRPSETVRQVKESVHQEPKLQKAMDQFRDRVVNNPKIDREVAQKVERAVREAVQLQQVGREGAGREKLVQALNQAEVELSQSESRKAIAETRPSEVVRQVKDTVNQEPKLQKAAEFVRDQVVNNPKVDREVAQKVERAVREAVQLQQVGREGAGRERLVQALNQAEVELSQVESQKVAADTSPSETVRQVKESVHQEPKLQKAAELVRDQVVNNPKVDREVAQKIERTVREAVQLQQTGREGAGRERLVQALNQAEVELSQAESRKAVTDTRPSEIVRQVKEAVHQETRLQKAVEQVRNQVVNNSKVDREVAQKVERAVREAVNLQQMGRESAGRERIVQALNQAEVELSQEESRKSVADTRPSESVRQVKESFHQEPKLQKAMDQIRDQVVNNPKIDREVAQKVERVVREAVQLQQVGLEGAGREKLVQALNQAEVELSQVESRKAAPEPRPSEVVRQVKETVQQEPGFQKAIDQVRDQVVNNPKIDREVAQKVERAVRDAVQLQQVGREGAGREKLVQALNQAEVELSQAESRKAASERRPSEVVRQVIETVEQEPRLQKAVEQVRDQVVNNPKVDREVAQKVERAVREAVQLQQVGREGVGREKLVQSLNQAEVEQNQVDTRKAVTETRPIEVVKQVKEAVQQEPRLQKVIDQVRDQVVNNPKIDREVTQKVERAVREAVQLQQIGREGAGREKLVQALNQAEVELSQVESRKAAPEPRPSEVVRQVKEKVQQEPRLQKAIEQVRDQVVNNPNIDREVAQKVERAVREAVQLQQVGRKGAGHEKLVQALNQAEVEQSHSESSKAVTEPRPSEIVRQAKESVHQEPNLQKAVDQVRDQVVNNPKIDREVAQKVERAVRDAVQLQQVGRESAGREKLVQALNQAEVELSQAESRKALVETRPSETVRQVKESVQQESKLQKVVDQVRDQVVNNPKIDREVAEKVERMVREAVQLQQVGREGAGREKLVQALNQAEVEQSQVESRRITTETRPSEIARQVKESVQQEPKLQRAVDQVREQVVNNPKVDPETARNVEKAVQEAEILHKAGLEGASRERLAQALSNAEADLNKIGASKQVETGQVALKDSINQIRAQLQTEHDINKVLPKINQQLINDKNIEPEIARNIEKAAKQANQLDQAGRDRLIKMLQQVEQSIKQPVSGQDVGNPSNSEKRVNQAQNMAIQSQPNASNENPEIQQAPIKLPSETIQQALKQFQSEANVEEALNLVRKEISSNPTIDMSHVKKIEQAIEQSQQLNDRGREIAARQHISKELTEIQETVAKTEPKVNVENAAIDPLKQFDLNEQLQSLPIQSKDILVTRITQKLAEATNEFREIKKEISRNLDSVKRIIDTYKQTSYPQAKQMLETAISKLDNAILKSDMMLFTDMKTERNLLEASSQLADAKKLLAKGDFSQASKIVGEVKELIDKINFKPTEQKVMHFVGKESMALENRGQLGSLENAARGFTMPEPSARQMFETVRTLGLNHDSELANSLVFKNGEQSQQEQQHQNNMKAVLMKLQHEEAGSRVGQQAEQALNNLTGQQLLSKSDTSGTMQSMLFNLPMLLGGTPENIQVYVNSKNEGQQVDWENCNLYFLLETKRLGDVGIMLSSTDRNLSITIKNDKPGFKEKMEPIASVVKGRLNEIGYNVNSFHFTRMTAVDTNSDHKVNQETQEQRPLRPIFTEKGMDFKI